MNSGTEYSGKPRPDLRIVESRNLDTLVAGFLAGGDGYAATGNIEGVAEQVDERLVGRALDRRGREADEQRIAAPARDSGAAGARDDPDL